MKIDANKIIELLTDISEQDKPFADRWYVFLINFINLYERNPGLAMEYFRYVPSDKPENEFRALLMEAIGIFPANVSMQLTRVLRRLEGKKFEHESLLTLLPRMFLVAKPKMAGLRLLVKNIIEGKTTIQQVFTKTQNFQRKFYINSDLFRFLKRLGKETKKPGVPTPTEGVKGEEDSGNEKE